MQYGNCIKCTELLPLTVLLPIVVWHNHSVWICKRCKRKADKLAARMKELLGTNLEG